MFYNIGQACKNISRNIRLSLASVATIAACIFLFCLFFSVIANLTSMIKNIETKVGITVFFDEGLSQNEINAIGDEIAARPEVKNVEFTSGDEAWKQFKAEYFEGREELAEGFADDNPLAGSANYTIFLKDIGQQENFVRYLESIEGIRQVNYSSQAGSSLGNVNKLLGIIAVFIVGILLAVSIFLISNTIAISAEFRKTETAIMRLIGATNHMIRAPFVIEGVILGIIGAGLPLIIVYLLYNYAVKYLSDRFTMLSDVFAFIPISELFPYMAMTAMILGIGMGFFASLIAIRKHMKV